MSSACSSSVAADPAAPVSVCHLGGTSARTLNVGDAVLLLYYELAFVIRSRRTRSWDLRCSGRFGIHPLVDDRYLNRCVPRSTHPSCSLLCASRKIVAKV